MDSSEEKGKFMQKVQEHPAVPIGLIGLVGVVAYGIFNFRHKKIKTSLYLIHLRLAAQGTVLGCVTIGLVYTLGQKHFGKFFSDKKVE